MKKQMKHAVSLLLAIILTLTAPSWRIQAAITPELPVMTFTGTEKATAVLANLDYSDVRASTSFAKEAIWETGALELMKGYASDTGTTKRFGLNDTLSVEQALAVAYIAAGREAEAQAAAETLDKARAADARLYPTPKMWSDGYIQLALNDGLLTQNQFADALQTDQLALTGENFLRKSSVTREDFAYYLGGVLKLALQYPQTRVFNSYSDWLQADPYRVPAIEAMLQNRIMHGDTSGRFRPKGFLTRAEAAQMLQNAEPVIFPLLGLTKNKGRVEGVDLQDDWTAGVQTKVRTVRIRNSDGTLHALILREPVSAVMPDRNELTGTAVNRPRNTVVALDGKPAAGGVLAAGQQIVYVSDTNQEVPYVQVQTGTPKTIYLGRVEAVDPATRAMTFLPYREIPFADIRLLDPKSIRNMTIGTKTIRHIVSAGAKIFTGEVQQMLDAIEPETHAIVVVEGGMITSFEMVDLDLLAEDGVVAGIVAENNASLGYVTLYRADGSGVSSGLDDGFSGLRTYSYADPISVRRDQRLAVPEEVIPGDSVFLKLDDENQVLDMSAAHDYTPVFGTVLKAGPATVMLRLPDGKTVQYPVPAGIPVLRDGRTAARSEMAVGDNIRLLAQINGDSVQVAEVRLEKMPNPVTAVYRGKYVWYDPLREEVVVSGQQQFIGGRWEPTENIGSVSIPLDESFAGTLPETGSGIAFIAVRKDAGGMERLVGFVLREGDRYDQVFDDTVASASVDGTRIALEGTSATLVNDSGTLVVRDGKLVAPTALSPSEHAMLSAGRDSATGQLRTDVIVSDTVNRAGELSVYRGRIAAVTTNTAFTLESFARLDGTNWSFFNTPKTFTTRLETTRLLTGGGVGNLREFTEEAWKGKSVYILSDGSLSYTISDATYGESVLKGRLKSLDGSIQDEFGMTVTEPTGLTVTEGRRYSPLTYQWVSETVSPVTVPGDAILIRKGLQANLSELVPGETVILLQSQAAGEAKVVIVK